MTLTLAGEQQLIAAADGIALTAVDLAQVKQRLHAWVSELALALSAHQIEMPGTVRTAHTLAQQASEVNALLTTSAQVWGRQWEALEPARQLAQAFEGRVMLLVFGKFNAGKSSLCNFLADRFVAHGKPVQYFHVASGQIVETAEPLCEGAVETTARLQGVCLGANLVLLDTPGLHSVTPENAALTQRFTDSADAVLWLTSSTSPGQVQELDALARELHRGKPLLPIITRSDVIEEDEVEGEIVKLLRNKSLANRLLQEADVQARGRAKLKQMNVEEGVLQSAVSVSVHTARVQGATAQAVGESGFVRLCAALQSIVDPAQSYRQRKSAEVMLHHLEENVLGAIESHLQPALSQLASLLRQERVRLQDQQPRVVRAVRRQVLPEVPSMLERVAPLHDVTALCEEIAEVLHGALVHQVAHHIGDHDVRLPQERGSPQIGLADHPDYERLYEAVEERIQQSITQRVELAFAQCSRGLDALEVSMLALQDVLAGQHDSLMHIKRHLRNDAVPHSDAGEARRH
nr:dynamin family protein [uncultured Albidiferax sp.]